jgi:hypothetical protein
MVVICISRAMKKALGILLMTYQEQMMQTQAQLLGVSR